MPTHQMVHFSPGRMLLVALLFIIVCGAVLLSLPIAQTHPISLFDAFFTTVSTVCVTGLQTVSLADFSFIGHCIILVLMQIGGLGLMTFSFFLASLFLNLGMTSKLMAGQLFEFESWTKIRSFLSIIIGVTLGIEAAGAAILFQVFKHTMNAERALFYAIFHSVSAFCNAGISLFQGSMTPFTSSPTVLLTLAALILCGGIGFLVWYELARSIKHLIATIRRQARPLFSFSLHTRLTIATSVMLIVFGTVFIWGIERNHSLHHLTCGHGLLNSFFLSVSMRTAGFSVIKFTQATHATILLLLALMFIGASPGSTGSGIKTTTFALFTVTIKSILQNRDAVEVGGRTIPNEQIYKCVAVIIIALSWVVLATFLLLLFQPTAPFLHILVEVISAFSTCGITMGITPQLSIASKIIIMITMIVGRIGLLTLVLALKRTKQKHLYRYPEERVLLG